MSAAVRGLFILITLVVLFQVNGELFGNASGRIINGNTSNQLYEYHAHLLLDRPDDLTRVGSGIVINRRLVLTTAQNILGFQSFRAGFGDIIRAGLEWRNATFGETISGYNPATLENNIGFLIFTNGSLNINGVTPIGLPDAMFGNDLPLLNEQGRVVGFGHTTNGDNFADFLQVAYPRVINQDDCEAVYAGRPLENKFCVYDSVKHGKICGGDQGGAFITNVNGQDYLTGISSYVLETECIRDQPALFIRILRYRHYITSMISVFH